MIRKGQIVEIPENALVYTSVFPDFPSKKEGLIWRSPKLNYSLFDGYLVGEHSGTNHFKIGQRKGINVGGKKEPLFVIAIDKEENRIFVGAGEHHPALWTEVLSFTNDHLHWQQPSDFRDQNLEDGIPVSVLSPVLKEKIPATLFVFEKEIFLEFQKPVSVTLRNYPITVFEHHHLIAEIK